MKKTICYKEYKNFKEGRFYDFLKTPCNYNKDLSEMTLYKIDDCADIGVVTSNIFYDYFMVISNSYNITLIKQIEKTFKGHHFLFFKINEITTKYKSEPFTYTISFSMCTFEQMCLMYAKIFSKIQLIKNMDEELLFPFSNIIVANLDNLTEIIKLNNENLFNKAIDNADKVFTDIYNTCKKIYIKIEEIDIQEQTEKAKILLEKNNEITCISREFFKDLNKSS